MLLFLPFLLPGIFGLAGAAIAGLVCAIIDGICDEDSIKEEVRDHNEFKEAIKIAIKSKSARTVNVGVYGRNETNLGEMEIKADGVSESLYVGQEIYL